ncbi:aa3-type cytochrome c oxidase subunit IV [Maritimibacter sp. DP1N21-5]|nr:aa3-type cytochrome c oxidase subunit IV [Maritimibacter sp. DP1N21-5]MBV7407866.1 aa3-type cytochrome c oxidase subunit IV [Maritimibacter sp. DP1N21-5]
MAEHEPGTMDIRVQEKTFDGFIKFTVRSVIAIIVVLILLAIVGA